MRIKISKIYMFFVMMFLYIPIIVMIVYSFNSGNRFNMFEGFSVKWYGDIWSDSDLLESLFNSFIIAFVSSIVAGIIGTMASYAMSIKYIFGSEAISGVIMLTIMIPEIILGIIYMAFFSSINMPLGMITLLISHTAFCIPYVMIMVNAAVKMLDKNLVDAAYDLGAGNRYAFFTITLPQLRQSIISGMLLSFAMSFDDVIISMFLSGARLNTLPVKINSQLKTIPSPKINVLFTMMFCINLIVVILLSYINKKRKVD